MGEETVRIPVAETSGGPGGSRPAGEAVSLPVVEILTGRGFVTGKSGSGKSNSASVVAERLLDNEFGLLIVDIDGEYYGLKEEYEILHVGADEGCDIQVTTDHADKLAGLALEQNVPIILDVSSYLDESEAESVLTEVARSLFAKAKKEKQPFLLLVEEIHEYIPEQGSVGECGQMLIKIGKRGRKHGLGLCGVSQRPADVKKDFITQCDWLLWHRLTWQNDTRVVRRILDGEYADAVENLDDGEGFLVTDWTDDVRRVQFHRKETFDAGATPGLADVERPALKSVSDDLVAELAAISDEASAREDRIVELERRLDRREARIEELEQELREARNLESLAEQFVDALTSHPAVTDDGGTVVRDGAGHASARGNGDTAPDPAVDTEQTRWPGGWRERPGTDSTGEAGGEVAAGTDERAPLSAERLLSRLDAAPGPRGDRPGYVSPGDDDGVTRRAGARTEGVTGDTAGTSDAPAHDDPDETRSNTDSETVQTPGAWPGEDTTDTAGEGQTDAEREGPGRTNIGQGDAEREGSEQVTGQAGAGQTSPEQANTGQVSVERTDTAGPRGATETGRPGSDSEERESPGVDGQGAMPDDEPLAVRELKAEVGGLETTTRRMLAFYREEGPASVQYAHFSAGGDGDRTQAYARNRTLRTRGLVGHAGRGRYEYRLRERLADDLGDRFDAAVVDAYATEIEETVLIVD